MLCQPFSYSEVRFVVFDMSPYKALSPDAFQPIFYQQLWDCVDQDLAKVALDYLNNGILSKQLNQTLLVLIPKIEAPENMK